MPKKGVKTKDSPDKEKDEDVKVKKPTVETPTTEKVEEPKPVGAY